MKIHLESFTARRAAWRLLGLGVLLAPWAPVLFAASESERLAGGKGGDAGKVRIGILTDTHFDRQQFPKRAENVRAAIDHFNRQGVDMALCLGDLYEGNFTGLDDYIADKTIFEPVWRSAQAPVRWVLGNHDHWGVSNDQFIQNNPYIKAVNYTVDVGDKWRVVIYSNVDGRFFAATSSTLAWLRTAMDRAGQDGKEVIIATHARIDQDYPGTPPTWTKEPYSAFSQNADRQRAIIDEAVARGVRVWFVLQGHHHKKADATRNGVKYLTFASTAEGAKPEILEVLEKQKQ